MKTRYLFTAICALLGLTVQAQSVKLVGLLPTPDGSLDGRMVLAKMDDGGKGIKNVQLVSFSLRDGKSTVTSDSIVLPDGYYLLPVPSTLDRNFEVPFVETSDRYAYRAKLITSDGTPYISELVEDNGVERFSWIGADIKWDSYTSGYNNICKYDEGIDGGNPFPVSGIEFYKSFSTHADGSFTFNFDADSPYSRFFTYYGIQDNKTSGDIKFTFTVNDEVKVTQTMYAKNNPKKPSDGIYLRKFETPINGQTSILITGDKIDDIAEDHMNFLLGRLYLKPDTRLPQQSTWQSSQTLFSYKPFKYTLDANFTSGGETFYKLLAGNEYASIEGNMLNVNRIPEDSSDYIEVLAVQPGTTDYLPSPVYRCKFYISNSKVVQKNERYVIQDGDEIDELTVYADPESRGQVVVENGLAKVKKLILKYTFTPGKWNFITFPANLDIDKASNLNELGYRYNEGTKAYYIRQYSTRLRAENPTQTAWQKLDVPHVLRNKGYIMGVSRSADNPDDKPVEVTFVLENATLGMDADVDGTMNVELNLTELAPGTEIPVYVMPDGVKGEPLRVMVRFSPTDISELPMNYARALEEVRVTFNPNHSGIRLTLPTEEPAKVIFFDRKGRIVKAVKYVSPYLIDLRDLKKGQYELYIEFGNANVTKTLDWNP